MISALASTFGQDITWWIYCVTFVQDICICVFLTGKYINWED